MQTSVHTGLTRLFLGVGLPAAAAVLLAATSTHAIPIAYDGFGDYNVGDQLHSLSGGSGWSGAWNVETPARRSETNIIGGGLGYTGGEISINGGTRALKYVATEGGIDVLADRPFPAQSDTVYLSFLYQSFNTDGNDFIQAGFIDMADSNPEVSALDRNTQIQGRTGTGGGTATGFDSNDFETFFMVLRAQKTVGSSTYDDVDLFVNPTSATEGMNAATSVPGDSGLDLSGSAWLSIRKAFHESGDTMIFDEFRIGTTFADVIESLPGLPPAPQMVLFEDPFDVDPASNGWTEAATGGPNPGDIFEDMMGQVVLASDGLNVDGNDFDTRSITRTIDATGFEHINVVLDAMQGNSPEADDILSILADAGDGMGFVEVFSVNEDFGTTTFGGMLPPSVSNRPFQLRIQGVSNVEDFFLDNLTVLGRPVPGIPEPMTAGLLGLAALALIRRPGRAA